MTGLNTRRAVHALLLGTLSVYAVSAQAQTVCNSIGETSFCHGIDGSSTMSQVGDITYVNRSNGSTATMQRVGDTTYITDSREGMSGVAQHFGETMIINLAYSSSVCSKVGVTMWCT